MKRCPECGTEYPDASGYCPMDGALLNEIATSASDKGREGWRLVMPSLVRRRADEDEGDEASTSADASGGGGAFTGSLASMVSASLAGDASRFASAKAKAREVEAAREAAERPAAAGPSATASEDTSAGAPSIADGDPLGDARKPRAAPQMRMDAFSVVSQGSPKATILVGGGVPQSGRDALQRGGDAAPAVLAVDRPPPGLAMPIEFAARAPVEETLVGRILDQRYRIDARIGVGGMGVVFRATHVIIDKALAIKVLRSEHAAHPEIVQRFLLEAQLASQIKHPNVVDISDYGQVVAGGAAYYVMEHLSGRTLAQLLDADGRLAPRRALNLAIQIAQGLGAAHARGIIHRDLKPDNVFLCSGPEGQEMAKILDFGIARGLNKKTRLTAKGVLIGTPAYMSPEQALSSDVDARSDIYSLGVILFEMLTGALPFGDKGPMEQQSQHLFAAPPTLRSACAELPPMPAVDRALRRLLTKNRDERPGSTEEVIALLRAARDEDLTGAEHALTASGRRRVDTAALGSGSVSDSLSGAPISGQDTLVDDDALTQVRGGREELTDNLAPVDGVLQPRTVSPSGRIQKRPSVIVKRGTKVERIEAPPPRHPRPDRKTDAVVPILSALSSERLEPPRAAARRRSAPLPLVIGVAAVVAMALTVTVWKYWNRPKGRTSVAASGGPAPSRRAPIEYVRLRFETSPPGATVLRNGRDVLGTSPVDFQVPKGDEGILFNFRLDGYVEGARTVTPDLDHVVQVTLDPRPPATTPMTTTGPGPIEAASTSTSTSTGGAAPTPAGNKPTRPKKTPTTPTTSGDAVTLEPAPTPEKTPDPEPGSDLGELKNPFANKGGGG